MTAFGVRCGADSVGHEDQDPTLQVRCPCSVSAACSGGCLQLLYPESRGSYPCAPAKQSEACSWPFRDSSMLGLLSQQSKCCTAGEKDVVSLR